MSDKLYTALLLEHKGTKGMTFDDIKRLADGFRAMEFDDFARILKETNGASIDYASGVWKSFKDSPLYYVTSRRPDTQGKALIEKAWELGA